MKKTVIIGACALIIFSIILAAASNRLSKESALYNAPRIAGPESSMDLEGSGAMAQAASDEATPAADASAATPSAVSRAALTPRTVKPAPKATSTPTPKPTSKPTPVVTPKATASGTGTAASALASKVISTAKSYLGVPYVWGGTTPQGFDCSGFIQYVYHKNGIELPRVTSEQYKAGVGVSKSSLRPGDLVFFETYQPGASHVGIYLGNSQFIHASSGGGKVMISNLTSSYYTEHYYGARRVIR